MFVLPSPLVIRPTTLTSLYIEWELEGDTFTVYRSGSPVGEFEVIAEHVTSPFYHDEGLNLYDVNVRYYYKVEGYIDTEKVDEVGPEPAMYDYGDNISQKVVLENRVVLRVMRNPPVAVLQRKRKGTRCPNCWNPITKKIRFANCEVCNGTGYEQGYHQAVLTRLSRDMSQYFINAGEHDRDNVGLSPIRAWMTNVPIVYPEDIVVDRLNQRFKIIQSQPRTKSQYVVRQVLEMQPVDQGHPSYKVSINWDGELYE